MPPEETKINPFAEDLNFAYVETVGQRSGQEDYCLFKTYSPASGTKLLAILADGMGGHAGGAQASQMAVETFLKSFTGAAKENTSTKNALSHAVKESNIYIEGAQSANPELEGMGCTLVGLYIQDGSFHWISVGDSPLYLYRQGRLSRLNEDHSMAPLIASALAKGNLTDEEAQNFPSKNALRSAIMGKPIELVDLSEAHLFQEGDVLILASDGLLTLTESEIEAELTQAPQRHAKDFAERLLNAVIAKEKPRQDNTTIMVIAPGKSLFTGQPAVIPLTAPNNATVKNSFFIVLATLLIVTLLVTAIAAYLAHKNIISVDGITQMITGKPAVPNDNAAQPDPQIDKQPAPLPLPQAEPPSMQVPKAAESQSSVPAPALPQAPSSLSTHQPGGSADAQHAPQAEPALIVDPADKKNNIDAKNNPANTVKPKEKEPLTPKKNN
jgi:protein phosphatase